MTVDALTPADFERLERDYRFGEMCLDDLAADFGVSLDWLRAYALRHSWIRTCRVGRKRKNWSALDIRRLKAMVQAGEMTHADMAKAFQIGTHAIVEQIKKHGWETPAAQKRAWKAKERVAYGRDWAEIRAEGGLCGGRILDRNSDEFRRWADHYEARDREERARREREAVFA